MLFDLQFAKDREEGGKKFFDDLFPEDEVKEFEKRVEIVKESIGDIAEFDLFPDSDKHEKNKKILKGITEDIKNLPDSEEIRQKSIDLAIETGLQSVDFIGGLFETTAQKKIEAIEMLNKRGLISDQQMQQRIRDEKRKAFIADRAAAVSSIIIQTAVAAARVKGQAGIGGIPISVWIIAQGALSAASVLTQPIPYAKGTKSVPNINGKPNQDSVHALLMPGEMVIPKSTAKEYAPILGSIFDKRVSPELLNSIALGGNSGNTIVLQENKKTNTLLKEIRDKETLIIRDNILMRSIESEKYGIISKNRRRFK
jgi:hypothetical protein